MIKVINNKGFIAVTSAILISVVLMAIIFSVSYSGFLNRFNILDTYSKERSRGMAEACVAEARNKLASDSSYTGNETITIGTDTCQIMAIESNLPSTDKTIKSKATVRMAVTNLKVIVSASGLTVTSWEELPNF